MKWSKRKSVFVIFSLLILWFSYHMIQNGIYLKEQYGSVSVRFLSGGVTEQKLNTVLESEISSKNPDTPMVTAWIRLSGEQITNPTLKRTETVPVVITAGDTSLIAPMELIDGNYVYKNDSMGCVLDSKSAYKLFGTYQATNNIIRYQNRDYHIRGVVKTNYPVFIIQSSNKQMEYPNLELTFQSKENGEALAGSFLTALGFFQDYVIIDGYFFSRIVTFFLALPLWLLFLYISYKVLSFFIKEREINKIKCVLYTAVGILILLCLGMLLSQYIGRPFYYPSKYIPTKWSDFNYWTDQYRNLKDNLKQIRYLNPNPKDVFLLNEISKVFYRFFMMTISYVIIIWYGRRIKQVQNTNR